MLRETPLRRALAIALIATAPVVFGCGPTSYAYAPVTTSSAELVGHVAADYSFPPDAPRGEIKLASLGLSGAPRDTPRSLVLRMVIDNRSQDSWVVDKREQRLLLAVNGSSPRVELREISATTAGAADARVAIGPGQSATVDLEFSLPEIARAASEVPAFDAIWTVHAGGRAIQTRTPFERFARPSPAVGAPTRSSPYDKSAPPDSPEQTWPLHRPVPIPDPMPAPRAP